LVAFHGRDVGSSTRWLTRTAWRVFAVDVVLGAAMIVAALTDSGDPAGRGLAEVYAVGCVILLLIFAAILGLSTALRSRIGLWFSIVIMVAPPILYLIGLVNQLRW
jgi:hypothetical protein